MKKDIIWSWKKCHNNSKPKFERIGFINDNGLIHINTGFLGYQKHQVIHFLMLLYPGNSLYMTQGENPEKCVHKWNQKKAIERLRQHISIKTLIDSKIDKIINGDNGLCFIRVDNLQIREYSELQYIPFHRYSWLQTSIDIGYYNCDSDGCEISCENKLIPEFLIRNSLFPPIRLSL